jgi:hypothetical protein
MVHIERKIEINSSPKKVFEILDDTEIAPVWNITVKDIEIIEPKKKGFVKTTVGDFTSTRTETVENKSISMDIDGGVFDKMGYVVDAKGGGSEVTLWAEFEDPGQEKILLKAGEVLLNSLKKYAEYLESGGDPKQYKKK